MDHLYKEILSFQHKVKDYMDEPKSHAGQSLTQAVQRLEDDVQVRKNAHSVEDQVKRVIHALEHAEKEKAMSSHHVRYLVEECEDFRRKLRKM